MFDFRGRNVKLRGFPALPRTLLPLATAVVCARGEVIALKPTNYPDTCNTRTVLTLSQFLHGFYTLSSSSMSQPLLLFIIWIVESATVLVVALVYELAKRRRLASA